MINELKFTLNRLMYNENKDNKPVHFEGVYNKMEMKRILKILVKQKEYGEDKNKNRIYEFREKISDIINKSVDWVGDMEKLFKNEKYHELKEDIFDNERRIMELIMILISDTIGISYINLSGVNKIGLYKDGIGIEEYISKKEYKELEKCRNVYILENKIGDYKEVLELINKSIDMEIEPYSYISYISLKNNKIDTQDIAWVAEEYLEEIELKNKKFITLKSFNKEIKMGYEEIGKEKIELTKEDINILKCLKI